jgi:hypothetical protein
MVTVCSSASKKCMCPLSHVNHFPYTLFPNYFPFNSALRQVSAFGGISTAEGIHSFLLSPVLLVLLVLL